MRIAVFVSGNGSNLQALIDAEARGELAPAKLALVISNKVDAGAIGRANRAGIECTVIPHAKKTREAFEAELLAELQAFAIDAVVLAGFMRVLTAEFTNRWPHRLINTHPSLLPAFPGVDAPAQAIAHGVKVSGVTVHFVDATLDGGPIIAQVAVPVFPGDDAAALHQRILVEEHRLLPTVVQRLAAGRLSCEGRIVRAE